jgi:HK97 family phage prohead protease
MELKTLPQEIKSIEGRTVTGIFSVFGNVDSYGDIVEPGAFRKTLKERKGKFFHLWQHNFYEPPIARVEDIKELSRNELPQYILKAFPESTGGMEVTRTYLDTPRANEVLTGIKDGVPYEMSFGFDAIPDKTKYEEVEGRRIRRLKEVKHYETSDVLWGANGATIASKAMLELARHDPDFLTQLKALLEPTPVTLLNAKAEPEPVTHSEDLSSVLSAIKSFGSLPEILQAKAILSNLGKGN